MGEKNQLIFFLLSIAIGFVGGMLYEMVSPFRLLFKCDEGKNKFLGGLFDLIYFVLLAVFCVFCAYFLHFPSLRGYILAGFGLGNLLYLKTLRRIVAFFEKVCYNTIRKIVSKAKFKKKLSKTGDKVYDTR